MEKCYLDDIFDLAELMYDHALKGKLIYATLFFEEATALMRSLLEYDSVSIGHARISEESSDGYNKEYYVVLDEDLVLSVEPAWSDNDEWCEAGYNSFEADEHYIDGNASYNIVKKQSNPDGKTFELVFADEGIPNIDVDAEFADDDSLKEQSIFDAILDLFKFIFEDDTDDVCNAEDEVLEFIKRRFPTENGWLCENCYYFALILKDRFPGGEICYDVINGHFSYKYNDRYYDHTGRIVPDGYIVKWDHFDMYDSIQKKRIIRDCLK